MTRGLGRGATLRTVGPAKHASCRLVALCLAVAVGAGCDKEEAAPDQPSPSPSASATGNPAAYEPAGRYVADRLPTAEVSAPHRATPLPVQWFVPRGGQKVPVVVWSPGGGETGAANDKGERWARRLAEAGYAVAKLSHLRRHPDAVDAMCPERAVDARGKRLAVGPCSVFVDGRKRFDRPMDVAVVLEQLDALAGAVTGASLDPSRVAVAGHSQGAAAALAVAGARRPVGETAIDLSHPRPRAFVALSAAGMDAETRWTKGSFDALTRPVLFATGAGDDNGRAGKGWRDRLALLDAMPEQTPVYRLFVPSHLARHADFNLEGRDERFDEVIASAVVAFLDAHVGGRPEAQAYLASGKLARMAREAAALPAEPAKRPSRAADHADAVPPWCHHRGGEVRCPGTRASAAPGPSAASSASPSARASAATSPSADLP